jgi:paraquat-inducible protein B
MSKKANTAAIGAFVIGAVTLAVVGILTFGSGVFFRNIDRYVLYFEGDLKGLNVGSPVAWRGVRVGQVSDIKVIVNQDTLEFKVPVNIEIDADQFHGVESGDHPERESDLNDLIKKGLRAQLSLQSLVTGQLMIQLDMRPDIEAVLRGDGSKPEIPTIPSSIQRLANALEKLDVGQMVSNINRAMTALENIIEAGDLEKLVGNIETAARDVAELAREMRERAGALTETIQTTARDAQTLMQSLDRQVDPVAGEAVQTMAQVRETLLRVDKALAAVDRLAAGYAADSAFRYELSTTLDELAATARSVRSLTDMLQQQPDALLRGKPVPGGN